MKRCESCKFCEPVREDLQASPTIVSPLGKCTKAPGIVVATRIYCLSKHHKTGDASLRAGYWIDGQVLGHPLVELSHHCSQHEERS